MILITCFFLSLFLCQRFNNVIQVCGTKEVPLEGFCGNYMINISGDANAVYFLCVNGTRNELANIVSLQGRFNQRVMVRVDNCKLVFYTVPNRQQIEYTVSIKQV